jgi:drug/metabolite transporter (DMT)-like permease
VSLNLAIFVLICLVWGFTWLPPKVSVAHVPLVFLVAWRFLLAAAVLILWEAARGRLVRPRVDARFALAAVLVGVGGPSGLFASLAYIPSGLAAVVNMSMLPVAFVGFGRLFGEERLDRWRAAAIGLGILGLAALFHAKVGGVEADAGTLVGLALVSLGTVSHALGAVLSRPILRRSPPLQLAAWQMLVGAVGCGLVSLAFERVDLEDFRDLARWQVALSLAFLVVFASLIAFPAYMRLLRDWGPFRSGLYCFVSPVIAVVVGMLVLGESYGTGEAVGSMLLFSATALAMRSPR